MIWNLFKIAPKSFLGVDVGTAAIKIVELSRVGKRKKLENYGEIQAEALYEKPFRTFEQSTLTLSDKEVVKSILAVMSEAKMKAKKAYFSIPDFSSFFTNFTLPAMTKEELPQAVQYEARQHIPLPLSEVTLDWQIIEGGKTAEQSGPLKILLVAVPNEIIQQYQAIAQGAGLELLSLEAEVFSLSRALIKNEEKEALALIDLGARSTTISVLDKDILKISHSFDTSGNDFTNLIAKSLRVDYQQAEELKKTYGLKETEKEIRESILPLIDLILNEIKKILENFRQTDQKEIKKLILAGGSALLPGLVEYFSENLGKPIEIAHPFADIYYPPILEEKLRVMGPGYAIALGSCLRGFEE